MIIDNQLIAFSYIVGEEGKLRFLGFANRNTIPEIFICYYSF
jgi:hypothetical protein